MGDIQVLAGLKMGSERLRLFFTADQNFGRSYWEERCWLPSDGLLLWLAERCHRGPFQSGKESFTKRESKMSTPKDILASDRDNFSISYEEIIRVDIDLALTAASFTILTRDDKFHFSVLGRREVSAGSSAKGLA